MKWLKIGLALASAIVAISFAFEFITTLPAVGASPHALPRLAGIALGVLAQSVAAGLVFRSAMRDGKSHLAPSSAPALPSGRAAARRLLTWTGAVFLALFAVTLFLGSVVRLMSSAGAVSGFGAVKALVGLVAGGATGYSSSLLFAGAAGRGEAVRHDPWRSPRENAMEQKDTEAR